MKITIMNIRPHAASVSLSWRRPSTAHRTLFDQYISEPESWFAWHSPQYRKALNASFPPDRWPATEITESDSTVRFVPKDGTRCMATEWMMP